MAKPKILHVIDSLAMGGAERLLVNTINSFPAFEHHLVYLHGSDALLGDINDSCKITKLDIHARLGLGKAAFSLRRYIRKHQIRVVHSHLCIATLVARLACPRSVKLFSTIHNLPSESYFKNNNKLKWLEKLTYRRQHHIVAICEEVLNDYDRCIGVKGEYTVLYNFIADKFFANPIRPVTYNGTLRLVSVGNLKYQKNYPFLLDVFKKLPASIQLDIYGAGTKLNELQEEITRHNLNVKICGTRHDMEKVLLNYDAFIMSSHYEGQPLAVLEAMALGLPVILSDIPVLHEVTAGKAVFFDLSNPDDLRSKLLAIANHEINLENISFENFERARKIARKEIYLERLKDMYMSSTGL